MARSTERELESIRRFFALRYAEEIRTAYGGGEDRFPLLRGHRLDLALVNGSDRAHFVYSRGPGDREHLVLIHHMTIGPGQLSEEEERRFVSRAIGAAESLAHFVLHTPFIERFDFVEQQAVKAAERHSRSLPHDARRFETGDANANP